jgi:hypothetical protein
MTEQNKVKGHIVRLDDDTYRELKTKYPMFSISKAVRLSMEDSSRAVSQKDLLNMVDTKFKTWAKDIEKRLKLSLGEF